MAALRCSMGGRRLKTDQEVSRRMPKGGGAQGAFESTLTGKAALFVAPLFMASVDGCRSHEEASALVAGLFQRRVAGAYQHKFGVGDLVKWFARHLLTSGNEKQQASLHFAEKHLYSMRPSSKRLITALSPSAT